jgi:hypothetical protein
VTTTPATDVSDVSDVPDVPDVPTELGAEDFVFQALLEYRDGRFSAVVRYDGGGDELKAAANYVRATVEPAEPDADGNRRVRVTGPEDAVRSAVAEYARRAAERGSYTLGDLGIASWQPTI